MTRGALQSLAAGKSKWQAFSQLTFGTVISATTYGLNSAPPCTAVIRGKWHCNQAGYSLYFPGKASMESLLLAVAFTFLLLPLLFLTQSPQARTPIRVIFLSLTRKLLGDDFWGCA